MTDDHDPQAVLAEDNPALAAALERKRLADALRAADREDLAIALEAPRPEPSEAEAIRASLARLGADWTSIRA